MVETIMVAGWLLKPTIEIVGYDFIIKYLRQKNPSFHSTIKNHGMK